MISNHFESKLVSKHPKLWEEYVAFWNYEYDFLCKNPMTIIWDGCNGKGREVFDGNKLKNAPTKIYSRFTVVLKKDIR